jgi:hypothetical protein
MRAARLVPEAARSARSLQQGGGVPPASSVDDQFPLEGGGVDFQRSERSSNIATAACLLRDVLEPSREPRLLESGLLLGGSRRLQVDLFADPFHLRAELPNPFGDLHSRRIKAELHAKLG